MAQSANVAAGSSISATWLRDAAGYLAGFDVSLASRTVPTYTLIITGELKSVQLLNYRLQPVQETEKRIPFTIR